MKTLIITALAALFAFAPLSAEAQGSQYTPEDYQIVSDSVDGGVRTIIAIPSPLVCTKKIVVKADEKTQVIQSVTFTRGCNGNLKAIDILLRGMTISDAVKKLDGNMCGNRGTSCTDQLCRILKKCYGIN